MATKIVIDGSNIACVWDDRLRSFLESMGMKPEHVKRASDVEMDANGDWVATEIKTGREIARGRNRQEVINEEVNYLERRL